MYECQNVPCSSSLFQANQAEEAELAALNADFEETAYHPFPPLEKSPTKPRLVQEDLAPISTSSTLPLAKDHHQEDIETALDLKESSLEGSMQSGLQSRESTSEELRNLELDASLSSLTPRPTVQDHGEHSSDNINESKEDHLERELLTAKENVSQIIDFREHDKKIINKLESDMIEYTSRLEELKEQVAQIRHDIVTERESLQVEFQKLKDSSGINVQELEELREQMRKLREENDVIKKHMASIDDLQKKVQDIVDENEQLKMEIEVKLNTIQKHGDDITALWNEYEKCIKKGDELHEAIKTVLAENPELIEQANATANAADPKIESKISNLHSHYSEVTQLVTEMQSQISVVQDQINALESVSEERRVTITNVSEGCGCAGDIAALKEEFHALTEEVRMLQKTNVAQSPEKRKEILHTVPIGHEEHFVNGTVTEQD